MLLLPLLNRIFLKKIKNKKIFHWSQPQSEACCDLHINRKFITSDSVHTAHSHLSYCHHTLKMKTFKNTWITIHTLSGEMLFMITKTMIIKHCLSLQLTCCSPSLLAKLALAMLIIRYVCGHFWRWQPALSCSLAWWKSPAAWQETSM